MHQPGENVDTTPPDTVEDSRTAHAHGQGHRTRTCKTGTTCLFRQLCPFCLVAGRQNQVAIVGLRAPRLTLTNSHFCTPLCAPSRRLSKSRSLARRGRGPGTRWIIGTPQSGNGREPAAARQKCDVLRARISLQTPEHRLLGLWCPENLQALPRPSDSGVEDVVRDV